MLAQADSAHRTFFYSAADGATHLVDGAGLGAGGQVGIRRELGADSSWWFDGALGEAYYHRPVESTVGTIFAGIRWQRPTDGWQPSVYLGGAHAHEAAFDRFKSHPAPVLFAVDTTIHHRTGLGADVALSTPLLRVYSGKFGFRFFGRLSTFRFFGDPWATPQYFQADVGLGLEY